MNKTTIASIAITILVIGGIVGGLVHEGRKPGPYDQLAQCIKDSGTRFYGAWWCPHCQRQKALFGKSMKKLPYVECQTQDQKQTKVCTDAKIEGYPTWIFADGSRLSGEIDLATLSKKTNCTLPASVTAATDASTAAATGTATSVSAGIKAATQAKVQAKN